MLIIQIKVQVVLNQQHGALFYLVMHVSMRPDEF